MDNRQNARPYDPLRMALLKARHQKIYITVIDVLKTKFPWMNKDELERHAFAFLDAHDRSLKDADI